MAAGLAVAIREAATTPALALRGAEHGDTGVVVFLAATGTAFAAYVVAVALLARRRSAAAVAIAIAVVVQLLPLAGPLLQSRDVYAYWDYGRTAAAHDANPYEQPPDRFPHDPAYGAMSHAWQRTTSVYGPVFTAASSGLAEETGTSRERAATTYRVAAALGMLVLVAVATFRARRRALAAATVGWNPVLALQAGGGGHNDVWMITLVVVGLALADRGRTLGAGASWALAIFTKWIAVGFVPLLLLARRARSRALSFSIAASCVALAGLATVLYGWDWLTAFSPLTHRRSVYSLPSRLTAAGLPRTDALVLVGLGALVAFVWLACAARRGRERLGLAAVVMLLATPWLLPWYAVWAVPLAADEDATARWLAIGLSAYLLPDRIPF